MRHYYRLFQYAAQVIFSALYSVRVFGRENVPQEGPVLLASNHQSFLDPVLCGVGLDRELDYIARDSLFRNRLFAWYIRSLNAFPIQRDQADLKAVKEIVKRLQSGRAVVLFPEATRTRDGRIRPIKSGIELIARRAKAAVVPVVIDGAFETWPRHQLLPGMGWIKVAYGEAIGPEQVRGMARGEFVEQLNGRLRQLQAGLRSRFGRRPIGYGDC